MWRIISEALLEAIPTLEVVPPSPDDCRRDHADCYTCDDLGKIEVGLRFTPQSWQGETRQPRRVAAESEFFSDSCRDLLFWYGLGPHGNSGVDYDATRAYVAGNLGEELKCGCI